ncbi:MAG: glycosylase [Planctomycetia bacterium]|nr:glycosylase [Planctomycetia bacterium]
MPRRLTHCLTAVVTFVGACLWAAATCPRAAEVGRPEARGFPRELVEFGPPSAAPLFAGGGSGAWDRDLRERGWIVRDGGCWHLWYTGSNPDHDRVRRLGYATSPDGLNWTRRGPSPLVADRWIEDVCVVTVTAGSGGHRRPVHWMFAEGEADVAHLLCSTDRVHWRPRGPIDIRTASGRPIDAGPRGTPAAWLEGGVWHLFYERMDRGVWLATSRDLETFVNVTDDPVLACGPEAYDRHAIAVDQIIRYRGRYYAYYHASADEDRRTWSTCIAASDDLVRWEKYAGNPILPVDPEHPKRSSAMLVPDGSRHRLYTTHPDVRVRFSVDQVPAAEKPK